MSDYFNPTADLDYLDERTHLIVIGYIRDVHKLVSVSLFGGNIPSEIGFITLSYIDDHFMLYRGSYEWLINDTKLIGNILSSQANDEFTSDVFEIAKLKWIIKLYPNGWGQLRGQFYVYVQLLSMPQNWDHIIIRQTVECKEVNAKFTFTMKYKATTMTAWPRDTASFNELIKENPNQLTINVSIKILRIYIVDRQNTTKPILKYQTDIINYKKHYKREWKISRQDWIKNSEHWLPGKRLTSNIFGDMFNVSYKPNESQIVLRLCGLPNRINSKSCIVDAIQCKWSVSIRDTDNHWYKVAKLSFSDKECVCRLSVTSFTFDDFKKFEHVTIIIDIEILSEFDLTGNIVGVDVEDEWNQFIDQQNQKDSEIKINETKKVEENNPNLGANNMRNFFLNEMKKQLFQQDRLQMMEEKMDKMMKEIVFIKNEIKKMNMTYDLKDDDKDNESKKEDTESVEKWIKNKCKLPEYVKLFIENGFDDLESISYLTNEDLKEMGIVKIGHRRKIYANAQKLKKG